MCEVGTCCGCIRLYYGSLLCGIVTIVASIIQMTIFSIVLHTSYVSTSRSKMNHSFVTEASAEDSSFYSFRTTECPFGFVLRAKPITSHTVTIRNEALTMPFPLLPGNDEPIVENGLLGTTLKKDNITSQFLPIQPPIIATDHRLINRADSEEFDGKTESSPSLAISKKVSRITCLAPTQIVLWACLTASIVYVPIGVLLITGVIKGMTCLLSTWFFYSVGYNLLALLVALTDGVYTGATDLSSYLVCLITAYCIIVVDSYYETLLREERVESSSGLCPMLIVDKVLDALQEESEMDTHEGGHSYPQGSKVLLGVPTGYVAPGRAVAERLITDSPHHNHHHSCA